MRGKLIVIEGTECSGKETQANLLSRKLNEKKIVTQTSKKEIHHVLLFDASVEFSICKKLLCMFSILNITPFNFSVTVVGYCAFWFGGEKGRIIYHDDRLGICKWVYLADFVEG